MRVETFYQTTHVEMRSPGNSKNPKYSAGNALLSNILSAPVSISKVMSSEWRFANSRLNFIKMMFYNYLHNKGVNMGFWRIVITILLPPLGVLMGKGFGWAFILNIILTLLGYIPGLIHAFWVQSRS